jgi:hypothetical protein
VIDERVADLRLHLAVARIKRLDSAIRQPRVTCMGGFPQQVRAADRSKASLART